MSDIPARMDYSATGSFGQQGVKLAFQCSQIEQKVARPEFLYHQHRKPRIERDVTVPQVPRMSFQNGVGFLRIQNAEKMYGSPYTGPAAGLVGVPIRGVHVLLDFRGVCGLIN